MAAHASSSNLADRIADEAERRGMRIAVAESLTGGELSASLAAAANASHWFTGGVVAYSSDAKFSVLQVTPGSTVTESCAREMARGVRELFGADIAVSVTGVGGPADREGKPAGTVYIGYSTADRSRVTEHHFAGEPEGVIEQTVHHALEGVHALVLEQPRSAEPAPSTRPIEIIDRSSARA